MYVCIVKRKMVEQSAKHVTRFTTNLLFKNIARRQLDGHYICYLEYICRPELLFIF